MTPSRTLRLGDAELTRIGLGTNRLRNSPENQAFLRGAVEAGVQMIDTAHLYTGGQSEATIGAALSPPPPGCMIATKGGYGGAGRGRPEVLRSEIEESLALLRTDHIALYYLHRVDPETPLEESLGAIAEYHQRGVIGQVGISDVDVSQIERARKVVPIAAVQNEYNLTERGHEDVIDHCAAEGIVFVPYYPLQGAGAPAVVAAADRHGATPTQVVLAWLLRRSPAMLPIPGTLSLGHLSDNLAAFDVELSDEEFEAIGSGVR